MTQTRLHSMFEIIVSTTIGFFFSLAVSYVLLPLCGFHAPSAAANVWLTIGYTVVSLIRQYAIRRLFNYLLIKKHLKSL